MLFHSSEAWGDGRETAKSKQRVSGAAPQAAAAAPGSPCSRHSEERHQCLDNWNTFRGQFFTGPPARPFPTVTVLLHRTQTSSSPLSRSLPPPHSYMDITHSKPSGAPAHTGHLQHCSVNVTTNQCHQTCHLQVRIFHQSNPSGDQLSHTHCTPCPAGQPALLRSAF